MSQTKPLTLEERVQRWEASPTPARWRRLRHDFNRAYGHALALRGAAKNGALKRLGRLPYEHFLTYDKHLKIQEKM
jgi:hypothetical protein